MKDTLTRISVMTGTSIPELYTQAIERFNEIQKEKSEQGLPSEGPIELPKAEEELSYLEQINNTALKYNISYVGPPAAATNNELMTYSQAFENEDIPNFGFKTIFNMGDLDVSDKDYWSQASAPGHINPDLWMKIAFQAEEVYLGPENAPEHLIKGQRHQERKQDDYDFQLTMPTVTFDKGGKE